MKNQNDMPQAILAEQFGLVYKALYFVEYKDPNYPCSCECHTNPFIMHCMPCCHDQSYQCVLMYSGVYREPDRDGHKSRGNYFLFTDPNPEVQKFRDEYYSSKSTMDTTIAEMDEMETKRRKIKNIETYLWFHRLDRYTITLHRRAWDKLPKNRHEPVDLPVDFSGVKND